MAAGADLAERKLNSSTFTELVNYVAPACLTIWQRDFKKAESEAALQCCCWARGLTRTQIQNVLGRPRRIATQKEILNLGPECELWCFKFGGNKIPIKIKFTNDLCTEATISDWSANRDSYHFTMPEAPPRHPILKVLPKMTLNTVSLNPKIFYKLKNYAIEDNHFQWQQEYRQAEKEACQAFCKRSLACSKEEIVNLVAQPFFRGDNIPGWLCSKPGNELWLYFFGGTNIPVRLVFQGDKCVLAEEIDGSKDISIYYKFREEKLCSNALGRPFQWIIADFGLPDEIDERNEKHPSLLYSIFPSQSINFRFNGAFCESTSMVAVAH